MILGNLVYYDYIRCLHLKLFITLILYSYFNIIYYIISERVSRELFHAFFYCFLIHVF